MKNGIKKIIDYNDDDCFHRRESGAVCAFSTPCYPEFHIGDDPDDFENIKFTWNKETRTVNNIFNPYKWCLFYGLQTHHIIKFEDGTEWELSTQTQDDDIAKIKDYIANGYETNSEMSRAARLLDDEMIYEI